MKKLFSIFFALLLALGCLFGCTPDTDNTYENDGKGDESISESQNESQNDTDSKDELEVVKDGKTEFSVWVEQTMWSERTDLRAQVRELTSKIEAKTGAKLTVSGDRYFTEADESKPAILIGRTKSESNYKLSESLRIGDYIIGRSGNKILIYAEHAEGAMDGIKYFIGKILTPETESGRDFSFKKSHEYTYKKTYGITSIKCLDKELYEYSLVIPENATASENLIAYTLRYHLITNYGFDLSVIKDSDTPVKNEILIGKTNRSTVTPDVNYYTVSAKNGKLEIAANGALGYENLMNYITTKLFRTGENKKYTLEENFLANEPITPSTDNGSFLAGNHTGDVRFMTYNVYGYGEGAPVNIRIHLQIELIKSYMPDIVGFQEYTDVYHTGLTPLLLELGYTQVTVDTEIDGVVYKNFTPMFYRADKLTQKASGFNIQTNSNPNELSKTTTWASFETTDGKKVSAIATHFMWSGDNKVPNHAQLRKEHAEYVAALSAELKQTYGAPVIFGADMNCNSASEPSLILLEGGLALAQEIAPEGRKNDNNGHHAHASYDKVNNYFTSYSIPRGKYTASIDHIYVTEGTTVTAFATLCSEYAVFSSDHSPLIVDVTL